MAVLVTFTMQNNRLTPANIHILTKRNIMLSELKAFLFRGDVLALAVAVIIAGAFQKIIDSLVADVIMPIIGLIAGTPDFSSIQAGGIMVGNFLNAIINFIIIGVVLFMLIRAAGKKVE
jgi:large conductance mechanosensitive channel